MDAGSHAGRIKLFYPKGSTPIAILAVAVDDRRLCDMAKVASRKAIADASGVNPGRLGAPERTSGEGQR